MRKKQFRGRRSIDRTNERTKTKLTRPRIRRTSRSALHLKSEEASRASPSSDDSIFSPSLSSLRSACMTIDAKRGAILSIIAVAIISSPSSSSPFAAATARAAVEMANATTSRPFFDRRLYVDGGNSHPRQSTTIANDDDDDDPFFPVFLLVVFLGGSIGR